MKYLALVGILLFLACKEKSSRGVPSPVDASSTVAAASTSPSPTASAAPPASGARAPLAPAHRYAPLGHERLSPPERQAFNLELAKVWTRLNPPLRTMLENKLRTQLLALNAAAGGFQVQVLAVKGLTLDIAAAPVFQDIATDRLSLAVPGAGLWSAQADLDIRLSGQIGLALRLDLPVRLSILDLQAVLDLAIDDRDPLRPQIVSATPPRPSYRIDIISTGVYQGSLLALLGPFGQALVKTLVDQGLQTLTPTLQQLQGLPGPIPGDGTPPLVDSLAPTPFEAIVRNVDLKLARDHLPHGTLLRVTMDQPQHDSWQDAYAPGGPGNQGSIKSFGGSGDSAIWTGHYLAAQCYRYAVTGERAALDQIRIAVEGLGHLIDVNGDTGLLARTAAPEASSVGQEILRTGFFRSRVIQGARWVGRQGDDGISRDQYSGAFFGLFLAHELSGDAQIRADAGRRITRMLDYLIARDWFVDEDRPAFDPAAGRGMPTYWLGVDTQRIAWCHIGNRVQGGRYDAEIARLAPLAAGAWLGAWLSTFNLDSYYKFNLGHINAYCYFLLEGDPVRWQQMARGYRIMRRYAGHHQNPHFDTIDIAINQASRLTLAPGVREGLRRFLTRNHRDWAPAGLNLSAIQYQTILMRGVNLPGKGNTNGPVSLPTQPLDIPLRAYTGYFLWQRTPFGAARPGQGNDLDESPGIDLVLPYWMGRYHAVFP